jgi:hypothetical protein
MNDDAVTDELRAEAALRAAMLRALTKIAADPAAMQDFATRLCDALVETSRE